MISPTFRGAPMSFATPEKHPENTRDRRRDNMVGVNMVLAKPSKLKHRLHQSCGIECVEGFLLEPCLLQQCFHVAGTVSNM